MSKKFLIISIVLFLLAVGYLIANFVDFGENNKNQLPANQNTNNNGSTIVSDFEGEKGEKVELTDGQIELEIEMFDDGLAHYYNTKTSKGNIVYFFVLKDKNGVYRAAANACQVCFDAQMGFRQEGDYMVCETCGNKYPLTKIATEKGGCNPGPINPNLEVENGKVIIKESELEEVSNFF